MAPQPTPSLPQSARNHSERANRLAANRNRYRYLPPGENQLKPICIPDSIPFFKERWRPLWIQKMVWKQIAAQSNRFSKALLFRLQKLSFNFDQLKAHDQLFSGTLPEFAEKWRQDECFGYRRIAGPNALSIKKVDSLDAVHEKMPFDRERIEARLSKELGRSVSLAEEAAAGRVFVVDFELLKRALRPEGRSRDTRWRRKYMPTPIGLFIEAAGFFKPRDSDGEDAKPPPCFVPLAIQIDQLQTDAPGEYNPVYYPDQEWEWLIAKLFFEVADENWHVGVGHVYRTHLLMDSFCMATSRQLSEEHPIYMLMRPHTRYTLATNRQAYKEFIKRDKFYFKVYAGTLEEIRAISITSRNETEFSQLTLESDLAARGVTESPKVYPYRDDARLWREPIIRFVTEYVDAFYESDASIVEDSELQGWAGELMHEEMGGLEELVEGGVLDTRKKLVDVLALVIFIAGPGHASQHFSQTYYYRHAPSFAASAYSPPPWHPERAHRGRFLNTLPPIGPAIQRFTYSTFGDLRFDRFADYSRYPLGSVHEAAGAIRRLHAELSSIETTIAAREKERFLPYGFLRPSQVPNSVNI
jgi:arachidonate 15-lipoxygenase